MYTRENFPSKAALKRAIAGGARVTLFAPGLGTPTENGIEQVEGPHYPKAHSWYAVVTVENGLVTAVR